MAFRRRARFLDSRWQRAYICTARPSSDPASPHCRFRLSAVFSFLDGPLRAVVHAHYSLLEEADMATGKVSNLSPLGSALLGKKKGDKISFDTPKGKAVYTLISI